MGNVLKRYHEWWVIRSRRIDELVKYTPILKQAKKLFDVHFRLLGILGVFATPRNDLDCYIYLFRRSKNPRYSNLDWKRRLRLAVKLIKRALK